MMSARQSVLMGLHVPPEIGVRSPTCPEVRHQVVRTTLRRADAHSGAAPVRRMCRYRAGRLSCTFVLGPAGRFYAPMTRNGKPACVQRDRLLGTAWARVFRGLTTRSIRGLGNGRLRDQNRTDAPADAPLVPGRQKLLRAPREANTGSARYGAGSIDQTCRPAAHGANGYTARGVRPEFIRIRWEL